jgi:transcriptional regulator with XRE-family HTH domain
MSKLFKYREKLNITQDELSEKAGISVRTIQRIESGANPKGHTLRKLSEVLNISENDLREDNSEKQNIDFQLIKIINLSSIFGIVLPPINILIPLLIIKRKKEVNHLTKQIISIQILWTIIAFVSIFLSPFLRKWFDLNNQITVVLIVLFVLVNLLIIVINSVSIDKNQKLSIYLNFSFI